MPNIARAPARKAPAEPPLIGPGPRIVGPDMSGTVHCTTMGSRRCRCAYSWEWRDGLLIKPPAPIKIREPCPAAEAAGHPCFPQPWQPTRVFRLSAAEGTPRGRELCAHARASACDEAERLGRLDAVRCELCRRPAGPAPRWALGCAPRELPSDAEQWRPHFWTEHGHPGSLHAGHICPQCAAIQDAAHAEGRVVVVTLTDPPVVSAGDKAASGVP
jgi:hypothetical protein